MEENQGKSELLQALRRVTDAMESEEFEVKDFQVDWSNGVQIVGVSNGILRRALTGDYTVKVRINLHNPAVHEKMLIALTGGK